MPGPSPARSVVLAFIAKLLQPLPLGSIPGPSPARSVVLVFIVGPPVSRWGRCSRPRRRGWWWSWSCRRLLSRWGRFPIRPRRAFRSACASLTCLWSRGGGPPYFGAPDGWMRRAHGRGQGGGTGGTRGGASGSPPASGPSVGIDHPAFAGGHAGVDTHGDSFLERCGSRLRPVLAVGVHRASRAVGVHERARPRADPGLRLHRRSPFRIDGGRSGLGAGPARGGRAGPGRVSRRRAAWGRRRWGRCRRRTRRGAASVCSSWSLRGWTVLPGRAAAFRRAHNMSGEKKMRRAREGTCGTARGTSGAGGNAREAGPDSSGPASRWMALLAAAGYGPPSGSMQEPLPAWILVRVCMVPPL